MDTTISKNTYQKWLLDNAQGLYDTAPFGYLVTYPKGLIFKTNQVIVDWLGYQITELIDHKTFQDLLSMGGKMYYETHHSPLEKLQGSTNELNYNLIGKNKKHIPVLVNTQVYYDEYKQPIFTRIFVYNITDRKRYEKELLLAKNKAEEATQIKSAFLSMVSHEIRTPLNAIVGTTDLLLKNPYLPDQSKLLNILNQSTQNLLELINNVLDLSKQDANKMLLEERNMHLRQNLKLLINNWQAKFSQKKIELLFDFDEQIPDFLIGDAVKIGQVINNLISNAIKFTSQGRVMLTVRLKQRLFDRVELFFAVEDTGMGIPQDRQAEIFDAFNQVNTSISADFGGTGLGLTISKNIIHLHGSQLQVESEVGEGSVFFFTLRLKIGTQSSEQLPQAYISTKKTVPLDRMKILLVEDNESNIFIASSYFNRWGLNYDIARNGQIAIDLVKKNDFDIVFMDLKMPIMNGYQATAAIRQLPDEKYRQLPIIALSASTQGDLQFQLQRKDFNDFLSKPFQPDYLYQFILSYQKNPLSKTSNKTLLPPPTEAPSERLPFHLQNMYGMLEDDEEAIQSFIPVVIEDLSEMKIAVLETLNRQDASTLKEIIHKNNTIFTIFKAVYLEELLAEATQILLAKNPQKIEFPLLQAIENAISDLLQALKKRLN